MNMVKYPDTELVKLDAGGNELWNKTFGGTNDDGFSLIRKTGDGGYIFAGTPWLYMEQGKHFVGDGRVVKTDYQGSRQWNINFAGLRRGWVESANAVVQTGDDGFIIAGDSDGS